MQMQFRYLFESVNGHKSVTLIYKDFGYEYAKTHEFKDYAKNMEMQKC